MLIVFVN